MAKRAPRIPNNIVYMPEDGFRLNYVASRSLTPSAHGACPARKMRLLERDRTSGIRLTKDLSQSELSAYKYAILSHTWGADDEEVTFDDVVSNTGHDKQGMRRFGSASSGQGRMDSTFSGWTHAVLIRRTVPS